MRNYIVLGALVLTTALRAQLILGPADMPAAGDTVRFRTSLATGIDPAPTEAGFIWDMGMLIPDLEGADTCVTVASTPLLYQFYFNNPFLYPDHHADFAQRGQSFDFQGQLTVTDVYEYYKKDAAGFRNVGFGANVNGIPTSVRRIPVDYVHRFPMTYGDMDTSFSDFTLAVPSLFSFTEQQIRYNEVDGYGTLYLPADTFEVLRVKSTLVRTDSVYVDQFGQGFSFPVPETIEYKWIAQGMDEPVLWITTVAGQTTDARFYFAPEDINTGLIGAPEELTFSVAPNPAQDVIQFTLPREGGTLQIMDSQGRVVRTERMPVGSSSMRMSIPELAPGAYLAALSSVNGERTVRFVVEQ